MSFFAVARFVLRALIRVVPFLLRLPLHVASIVLRLVAFGQTIAALPRRLREGASDVLTCPRCGLRHSALGRFRCAACGAVETTHAWAPCGICGSEAGYVACENPRCHEVIQNPRFRSWP